MYYSTTDDTPTINGIVRVLKEFRVRQKYLEEATLRGVTPCPHCGVKPFVNRDNQIVMCRSYWACLLRDSRAIVGPSKNINHQSLGYAVSLIPCRD